MPTKLQKKKNVISLATTSHLCLILVDVIRNSSDAALLLRLDTQKSEQRIACVIGKLTLRKVRRSFMVALEMEKCD